MITFKQFLTEAIVVNDDTTSTFMEYSIRNPTKAIPVPHVWLSIIRTKNVFQQRKGGETRLLDKLKTIDTEKGLPIYLDPIGPKARRFFTNRGFQEMQNNPKIMHWNQ